MANDQKPLTVDNYSVREDEYGDRTLIHTPDNKLFWIDGIYAVLSEDERGNEGLCAANGMPAIFADPELADTVLNTFRRQTIPGRKVKLVRFTHREDINK